MRLQNCLFGIRQKIFSIGNARKSENLWHITYNQRFDHDDAIKMQNLYMFPIEYCFSYNILKIRRKLTKEYWSTRNQSFKKFWFLKKSHFLSLGDIFTTLKRLLGIRMLSNDIYNSYPIGIMKKNWGSTDSFSSNERYKIGMFFRFFAFFCTKA